MDTIKEFFQWVFGGLGFLGDVLTPAFWTALLIEYKYWVVIAGALIEGEILLMLAGGSAYHGYLSLPWVMLIAFIGAVIHDHLLFFVGRHIGSRIIYKYTSLHNRAARISEFMHKYDRWFIMSFRFIYGVRTVTPIIVGTTSISWKRYSFLVTVSALIWAVIIAYLGYTFAIAIEALIENFEKYSKYFAAGLVIIALIIYGLVRFFKSRNKTPSV
jgi:membrane protein DedA with SNARE-associated domain